MTLVLTAAIHCCFRERTRGFATPNLVLARSATAANMDPIMKNNSQRKLGPQTRAIHAGEPNRRGVNGPIVTEIIRSSTFSFSSTAQMKLLAECWSKTYIYTRYCNAYLAVS